jgi:hypothetical protein
VRVDDAGVGRERRQRGQKVGEARDFLTDMVELLQPRRQIAVARSGGHDQRPDKRLDMRETTREMTKLPRDPREQDADRGMKGPGRLSGLVFRGHGRAPRRDVGSIRRIRRPPKGLPAPKERRAAASDRPAGTPGARDPKPARTGCAGPARP